ncbi:hypothetical protein A9K55_001327 [Cordyceps militaris]|uniref:Uncharacterized protein n=1 Tax=Cordyceps militaris TaxID=73501 RepID=A0A2H4SR45_CORMI|nr:hypothetical protein A9K55_001327 [Cordyceps militaris]
MASDPGDHGADIKPETANSPRDAAPTHHDENRRKIDTQAYTRVPPTVAPQPIPIASARIPVGVPRSRTELHRRRSQILDSGSGSGPPGRGTGVQKSTARPPEQAASLRKPGSSADGYRPGAAAAATRERMYQMLAAAASSEDLAALPTIPTRPNIDDKQNTPLTRTRPIAIPRTRRNVDVEMLEASMRPPPVPMATTTTTTTAPGSGASSGVLSSSLPLDARDGVGAPSSSSGGGLKRSASNSSQTTVTVIECPILEVDEKCGNNDEDLSWLGNDQELEQMMAMASSHRRTGGARSSLTFRRSQEAAMQCSQVVRNVPRMRKRRGRKLDHRRHSMTRSESTICLSASPSPTATPVG